MAFGIRVQKILSIFILHNNPENFLVPIGITGPRFASNNNILIILARRGKNSKHAKDYRVYPNSKILLHDD